MVIAMATGRVGVVVKKGCMRWQFLSMCVGRMRRETQWRIAERFGTFDCGVLSTADCGRKGVQRPKKKVDEKSAGSKGKRR